MLQKCPSLVRNSGRVLPSVESRCARRGSSTQYAKGRTNLFERPALFRLFAGCGVAAGVFAQLLAGGAGATATAALGADRGSGRLFATVAGAALAEGKDNARLRRALPLVRLRSACGEGTETPCKPRIDNGAGRGPLPCAPDGVPLASVGGITRALVAEYALPGRCLPLADAIEGSYSSSARGAAISKRSATTPSVATGSTTSAELRPTELPRRGSPSWEDFSPAEGKVTACPSVVGTRIPLMQPKPLRICVGVARSGADSRGSASWTNSALLSYQHGGDDASSPPIIDLVGGQ